MKEVKGEINFIDELKRRHCTMPQLLEAYQVECIRQALVVSLGREEGGITRAARLLGITHQRLCMFLNRHPELDEYRAPKVSRLKSYT